MTPDQALSKLRGLREDSQRKGFPRSDDAYYAWAEEVVHTLQYVNNHYCNSFATCIQTQRSARVGIADEERDAANKRSYEIIGEALPFLERKLQLADLEESMTPEQQLLVEFEELLRAMPTRPTFHHETPENLSWLGRCAAIVEKWDTARGPSFRMDATRVHASIATLSTAAINSIIMTLHEAVHDLQTRTGGPKAVAVPQGATFAYFDELRKLIETARTDILFVDPYLNADFVARYLPYVVKGVTVRLLTKEKKTLSTLVPAVTAFVAQHGTTVSIRSSDQIHDRYLFLDHATGYQSGGSFKDGARNAPTLLSQVMDAFAALRGHYEGLWGSGRVER